MKKTTSQKLTNRIAKYGALSIAIAGIAEANGQVMYCDNVCNTNLPFIGGINDVFLLDLDGDGTDDFRIYNSSPYSLFMQPLNINNEAIGVSSSIITNYILPYALNSGAPISNSPASGSWFNNGFSSGMMSLNYGSQASSCSIGYWCGVTDKFLGLRFDISGMRHYGWARLDVDGVGNTWVVRDYAYEQTPNVPISAGDGIPLGLEENVFSGVKIVSLNKSIALFNLPQQTNYRLFSLTGQSVLNGKIANNTHTIEANTLASGIYIIELQDSNTKAVMRKKLVL